MNLNEANLRGKIREFLTSEEGKVVVKAPLSLGIVSGTFWLTQVVLLHLLVLVTVMIQVAMIV